MSVLLGFDYASPRTTAHNTSNKVFGDGNYFRHFFIIVYRNKAFDQQNTIYLGVIISF